MKLRQLLLTSAVAAFVSQSAMATVAPTNITFDATGFGTFGKLHTGAFDDLFNFTIPAGSLDGSVSASFKFLSSTGWLPTAYITAFKVFNGGTLVASGDATGANPLVWDAFSTNLGAGSYTLKVAGYTDPRFTNGSYAGSLQITAVPEPGEWAMMLAGLGLLGAAAKRRRSTDVSAA